jgi:hypothetical protein
MKKIILILLCLTLLLGVGTVLGSCQPATDRTGTTIVAVGFAGYDFARSVLSRYT